MVAGFRQAASEALDLAKKNAFEATATDCIENAGEYLSLLRSEKPLKAGYLKVNPVTTEPWRRIMSRNSAVPTPRDVPVFVAQGTDDTTVAPAITHGYVKRLCRSGVRVRFRVMEGVGHVFAAKHSAREVVRWIGERFEGDQAPNDCAAVK